MSSESYPATQITEERTVVSSLDDSAPVKDLVSTTTSTSVPSTTSATLATSNTLPTSISLGWCQGAANVGAAVGQGAVNVGSKVAEMVPSGEQVKDAGVAVGSGAYNTGAAVGSGAYNASAAVGTTAANAGSAAANTVSNTASAVGNTAANAANYIKDTVKEYLPTSVVGSSPSTSLASIDDDKRYSQTSLPSVTDSPVPSSHPKSSHTLPSAKTQDLANTGGVTDLSGERVARLPGEHDLATKERAPTHDSKSGVEGTKSSGATAVGAGALPGYMGESNVAPVLLGDKDGADSLASTRTLAGSIAPSTSTSVSGSGSGFESSTHPSTGTNPSSIHPSITTAHPSTTSAAATYLSTATNPSTTSDTPQKGTMDEAKDLFLSMQPGSTHDSRPGAQTHKQESLGRQQSVDTPLSTCATIGHGTPPSSTTMSSAGERLTSASAGAGVGHVGGGVGTGVGSTANTGPYPRTSTTGGPVSGQHPDMPTAPSAPHTGRHAGATEARYTSSNAVVSGAGGHTDAGKEKATLKDKIKGEAKVISGKIGGNEEKVEVGKRMMGKN